MKKLGKAINVGAKGIVVSNHGGRQYDYAVPSIEALPSVILEVNGEVPVFLDTGVRKGSDIIKALALGCKAVLVGRPIVYGLACEGSQGVKNIINILKDEMTYDMQSLGLTKITQINNSIIFKKSNL